MSRRAFPAICRRLAHTLRRPLAIAAAQLVGARYAVAALRLLTAAVAARLLGPEGYGTVALVVVYPSLVWSIFGTKSEALTTRYMAVYRTEGKQPELLGICKLGYAIDLIPALVASLLVIATSRHFAVLAYDRPELAWLMNLYAGALPFASVSSTSTAVLTSHQAFRVLSVLQVLHALINTLAVIGLLMLGFGVPGMVLGLIVGQISIGLTLYAGAARALARAGSGHWWRGRIGSVAPVLRELTQLLGWNYVHDTLRGVLDSLPVMMLGHYRSPEETAFYRLAANIANVGRYAGTSLSRMIYPIVSERMVSAGMSAVAATIKQWTLLGAGPVALLLGSIVLLLPDLIPLVFGSDYQGVVLPAQIMILGASVDSILFWVHPCYYATKRVGVLTQAFAVYVVGAMVAVWLLIGDLGLTGVVTIIVSGRLAYLAALAAGIVWRG